MNETKIRKQAFEAALEKIGSMSEETIKNLTECVEEFEFFKMRIYSFGFECLKIKIEPKISFIDGFSPIPFSFTSPIFNGDKAEIINYLNIFKK